MNKNSYFECKRCFYKCYQKGDIQKHLDKKKLCNRILESYKYNELELKDLSLQRIYVKLENDDNDTNYKNICECCGKRFIHLRTLKKHNEKCKLNILPNNQEEKYQSPVTEEKNEELNLNNNLFSKNDMGNSNCSGINIVDNSTKNITQHINLNINLINSFDEQWNTTHIDDKTKVLLLLNNTKFTSTLENILENEVNLNVLIDETSEKGLVYNEKKNIKYGYKRYCKKNNG